MVRRKRRYKRKYQRARKKSLLDYIVLPRLPRLNLDSGTKRGVFIVFILALGAISLLGLFDLAGMAGQYLKQALMLLFGWGKWMIPLILLFLGYFLYNEERYYVRGANYLGLLLFILSFHAFLFLIVAKEQWPEAIENGIGGGYTGILLASGFTKLMGLPASFVVIICLVVVSLLLMFETNLLALFGKNGLLAKIFWPITFVFSKLFRSGKEEAEEEYQEDLTGEKDEDNAEAEDVIFSQDEIKEEVAGQEEDEQLDVEPTEICDKKESWPFDKNEKEQNGPRNWWTPTGIKINLPIDLLNGKKGKPSSGDIERNIKIIKDTLENFGIAIEVGEISVGPTVTQYTFKPAEGVKLSRIVSLSNDLALALAAHPIRIEAPIPGKALVGIEVPNQIKALVSLKEILLSQSFKEKKSRLTISLGNDVAGRSWIYDISKMPHLLVAGATNSGKSVCLNSIIISLLYQNNPDDLRFIMVDPKRLELPIYDGIPHLLIPVITDANKTINALKWCLNEMDRRLNLLSEYKKKNIQIFNKAAEKAGARGPGKIPYIIFIIDELADLMMVNAKEVEAGVIRLTQMARAVGIHLILATQRPSVDVITGLIKANMPARIAFATSSGTDSRTILDSLGAEKLLGRGDMLFTTAEISKPKRMQGAFVGESEIKRVVHYIKEKGGRPYYIDNVTERQKVQGMAGIGLDGVMGDEDELLEEAKEVIINANKASATFLQRRLGIGYARAAKILDMLEEAGVIGPANGAKPREILVTKGQYENLIRQGVSGVSIHSREEANAPDEFLFQEKNIDEDESDTPPIFSPEENNQEDQSQSEDKTKDKNTVEKEDDKKINKKDNQAEITEEQDKDDFSEDDDEDEGMYYAR